MKNRKIGFGVFLISIGVLWLLGYFGLIDILAVLGALFKLWPLIIVAIGINIIFKGNSIVKSVVWISFLAVILTYSLFIEKNSYDNGKFIQTNNITIEQTDETKHGNLHLSLGAGNLELNSTTGNLIDGSTTKSKLKQSVLYRNGKETAVVNLEKGKYFLDRNFMNETVRVNLNENTDWELDINAGLENGTLNMSKLKLKQFTLDVGLSDLKLIFGNNFEKTDVKINAGLSDIEMVLPKELGVRINVDGGLNDTNLDHLGWNKESGYYQSPGYSEAKNKMNIKVDMGLSHLEVIQQ
ncbi:MAG: hypothetical protein N2645_02270 [Clostridia bacterium]|nr:hypothetical protein [Clostridia bacterium]